MGAIARSYKDRRSDAARWRNVICSKMKTCGNLSELRPTVLSPGVPGNAAIRRQFGAAGRLFAPENVVFGRFCQIAIPGKVPPMPEAGASVTPRYTRWISLARPSCHDAYPEGHSVGNKWASATLLEDATCQPYGML